MPSSSFALSALGALGCVFLEPDAVSADANTKPREVRARALGGMGGIARAQRYRAAFKPCRNGAQIYRENTLPIF